MTKNDIIRMARDAGAIDSDEVIETVYATFAAADRADLLLGDVEPLCWAQPTTAGLYISNEKDTVYTMPLFTADQMAAAVAAHKAEVITAEAYRCGYEAGVIAERKECAALAEKTICDKHIPTGVSIYGTRAAKAIRARTTP